MQLLHCLRYINLESLIAMYLSLNDWSTGVSLPIPPDTTPNYDDGLARLMSKLTLG